MVSLKVLENDSLQWMGTEVRDQYTGINTTVSDTAHPLQLLIVMGALMRLFFSGHTERHVSLPYSSINYLVSTLLSRRLQS